MEPLKALITNKGILFSLHELEQRGILKKLKSLLTFTKEIRQGRNVTYKKTYFYNVLELPSKKLFAIARIAFHENFKNIKNILGETQLVDKLPRGDPISRETLETAMVLNDNQQIAHNMILSQHLNERQAELGAAGCVFIMEAGLGKSFVAAKIIETMALKTLLVVMNTDQLEQWRDDVFAKWYPKLKVGEFYTKRKKDGDVVIVIINSLNKLGHEYVKKFGLIVFDEIPEFMGLTRQEAFWHTGCRFMLGLTATPDERSDGMDIFYKKMVGPLLRAKEIENFDADDIVFNGNVTALRYYGPKEYTERLVGTTGQMNCSMMNEQFSKDPYRNALIVEWAKKLYESGKQIFIFAQKRDHLKDWRVALIKAGLPVDIEDGHNEDDILDKQVKTLMGKATKDEKIKVKSEARIILTTYKFSSIGMSIVRMDAIIFATPQKSKMRQILGRILRRGGDPSIVREIVDIIDNATDLKKQYDGKGEKDIDGKYINRLEAYKEKKFNINEIVVKYPDIKLNDIKIEI